MKNEVLKEQTAEVVRNGITERQWGALENSQKLNWRIALFAIVSISYLILHLSASDALLLFSLPNWVSHIIGVYSSCCILLLTAGEREYSSLSLMQQKIIDLVWRIGGSIIVLFGGILFVTLIATILWKGPVQILLQNSKGYFEQEWVMQLVLAFILIWVIYKKFITTKMLYACFQIPQFVGETWIVAAVKGSLIPLAKIESCLAIAFSVAHIVVIVLMKALLAMWFDGVH